MKIITGSLGEAHVTSNNDGEFNQGLFGSGLVILNVGNKLAYSIVDNNTITIADGDVVMQGRHAVVEPGTTDTITIETCTIGYKRNDLICLHYELDEQTGYESIEWKVVKGTEATSPEDPEYTTGDIRTGSVVAEMPLYRVCIDDNAAIESVTCLASVQSNLVQQSEAISANATSISSLQTATTSYTRDLAITLGSAWSRIRGSCIKIGRLRIISLELQNNTAYSPSWIEIGSVESDFLPQTQVVTSGEFAAGLADVRLETTGVLFIYPSVTMASGRCIYFQLVYSSAS